MEDDACVSTWDLAVVLERLSLALFEPIESAMTKNLTFKIVFLLALTSLKRVGDIQALAISPTCLEFSPGGVKAILHPRPGNVPKVPPNVARLVVLQAIHPPPHVSAEEERLHLLCPVRALNIFIQKSSHWRRSEQWLMCFGSPKKGLPASKQTISNWIIQAITLAYQVRGLPSPVALRAHSTRGMASSRALLSGVPFQEICDGGPPRILSSDFIAWTFPPRQVHEFSHPKFCLVQLHTRTGMFRGGIMGTRSPSCRYRCSVSSLEGKRLGLRL